MPYGLKTQPADLYRIIFYLSANVEPELFNLTWQKKNPSDRAEKAVRSKISSCHTYEIEYCFGGRTAISSWPNYPYRNMAELAEAPISMPRRMNTVS